MFTVGRNRSFSQYVKLYSTLGQTANYLKPPENDGSNGHDLVGFLVKCQDRYKIHHRPGHI